MHATVAAVGETPYAPTGAAGSTLLWESVDRLLAGATVEGIRVHELGPLASRRLRRLGLPVPPLLEAEERVALRATMTVVPLLQRIRSSCDGPLLVFKGPEVARLYPGRARSFVDVDLLAPDAEFVHRALLAAGFVEVGDPELFRNHHHLRPLKWPALALKVEIHSRPMWPDSARPPAPREIVEAAVPSGLGIDGLSAPNPVHHALMLAAHAWVHVPLHTLRDLVDVAAVSAGVAEGELDRVSRAWCIPRIWSTTRGATDALFGGRPWTAPLRLWARHLGTVRERTVLDNHLIRWLHPFWELPFPAALLTTAGTIGQEILPDPDEPWRDKLARARHALRHPGAPLSWHKSSWREPARRSGERRDED